MLMPITGSLNENQLMLITYLGIKSIPRLVNRLEQRIDQFTAILKATEGQPITPEERTLRIEETKAQVLFLYRLALFLNMILKAPSPETVRILTDLAIGKKLSDFLTKIDPHLKHKNVHYALTKFFKNLCESEIPGLKMLIIDFEFPLILFKKNMKKYNVISSQYLAKFEFMGKNWSQEFLQYVKHNIDQLQLLSDDVPILAEMLKTYVDEKGDFILTNPEDLLLKKTNSDMYMNSESPASYLNIGSGFNGLGINVFEDTDKDLLKDMGRYIHSRSYSEE